MTRSMVRLRDWANTPLMAPVTAFPADEPPGLHHDSDLLEMPDSVRSYTFLL